jgi:hypothetical protein
MSLLHRLVRGKRIGRKLVIRIKTHYLAVNLLDSAIEEERRLSLENSNLPAHFGHPVPRERRLQTK